MTPNIATNSSNPFLPFLLKLFKANIPRIKARTGNPKQLRDKQIGTIDGLHIMLMSVSRPPGPKSGKTLEIMKQKLMKPNKRLRSANMFFFNY